MSPGSTQSIRCVRRPPGTRRHVSKIKRLRAVLTGAVTTALAVGTLPVLAVTAHAAADPLGGQPGPVTLSPTMSTDTVTPVPPAGTSLDDFYRHPVLSWTAIT